MMAGTTSESKTRNAEDVLLGTFSHARNDGATLVVCSIYEDQRPFKGAAGALDWRLRGFLSRFVLEGRIEGKKSEFVYVPIKHQGVIRHLLTVGLGPQKASAKLEDEGSDLLKEIASTVVKLGFKKVAISGSSFPFFTEGKIKRAFKNIDAELIE